MEIEKRELTLTDLENVFNQAIGLGAKYIGVKIKYPNMKEHLVKIHYNSDFETELECYKNTHNEDLTYVVCEDIKIIAFEYGETFAELQDWLCC